MSMVQTEKEYQKFIVDYLTDVNGYIEHTDRDFNSAFAFDNSLLLSFLYATQKEAMQKNWKRFLKMILQVMSLLQSMQKLQKRDPALFTVLSTALMWAMCI